MNHLSKFLAFWCLLVLLVQGANAQSFNKASTGWVCESTTPFSSTTFYYDGVTPTTGILSLVQGVGVGFNITSATSCGGQVFYCATTTTELVRAVVTNVNSSTFSATTPHWLKGTVVLPNSKVYITVSGGSPVEMTKSGNVYTADVNFGNTGIGFTISGDMPSASTIRGEQGLENDVTATGLPLTGGVLTAASVQLSLTGFTSQYSNATISFNLLTNQVTQVSNNCPKPSSLTATEITSTTAKLEWTAGGSETSWNIEYGLVGFAQGNGTTVSGVTTNYSIISGLNPGTDYQFYVQADCGGANGTSLWVGPYSFSTPCIIISSFPYSNNFDGLTAFPSCFSKKTTSSASVAFKEDGGYNGTACIEMNYGYYKDCYFILPQTSVPVNTLQLGFYFEDGTACTMKMGYFDASLTTFTEAGSVNIASGGQSVAFDFGGITGLTGTERIAIKYVAGGKYYNGRLDNLTLSYVTCPKPKDLTASNITSTGATLGWTAGASETSWNVEYGLSGFTQGTGTTISNATTNSCSLTGLNWGTNYQFYVQTNCSSTDDKSLWAGPFSFTTLCDAIISFPYTQDFNNVTSIPNCFDTKITAGQISWKKNGVNGTGCLLISVTGDCYLILPATLPLLNTFDLSFSTNVINYQYTTYTIGYFDPTLTTFTPLVSTNNSSQYQNFKVSLNNSNTLTGNERIAIKLNSSLTADFFIDDITLTHVSCRVPFNLSASNVTTNSATLGWNAGDSETSWTLEYGFKGFAQGDGTTVNTTTTSYQLNNLKWGTEYDFNVRANCSADNTSIRSVPFTFVTPCQDIVALPYCNNFNHLVSMPLCFDTKTDNGAYIKLNFNNTTRIRMYNGVQGNCYLILPHTQDLISTLKLRFRLSSVAGTIRFGYFDAGLNTFTELSNQPALGDKTIYASLATSNTLTGNERIAIKLEMNENYADGYLDDLVIYNSASCVSPVGLGVLSLTSNSATLKWLAGNGETSWNIEYGEKGFVQGTGTVVAASSNPFTITGLAQGTEYDIYVQSACGAGNTSTWSNKASFCTTYTIPFTEGFDKGYVPSVWSNGYEYPNNEWYYVNGGSNPVCTPNSPTGMLTYNGFMGDDNFYPAIICTPKMDLTGKKVLAKIWVYRNSLYSDDYVDVFISENTHTETDYAKLGTIYCNTNKTPAVTANGFYEYTFAVPDTFNTTENYLVVRGMNTSSYNIYIDDISITEPLTNDMSTETMLNVPANINILKAVNPKTVIRNLGTTPVTAADVNYTLTTDENTIINNTVQWTGNLAFSNSDTLALPQIMLPDTGNYILSIRTILAGDQNLNNDTLKTNIYAYKLNMIFDNGPFVTDTLENDTLLSVVQHITLGFGTMGISVTGNNRLADEFVIPAGQKWNLNAFADFSYQDNSGETSSTVSQNVRIWTGNPANGGTLIYDFSDRNVLLNSEFTSAYRISETNISDRERTIMNNLGSLPNITLPVGTYWLDWNVAGDESLGGPFSPMITIKGQAVTGNGIKWDGTNWVSVAGSTYPQGIPFQLFGNIRYKANPVIVLPDSNTVNVALNAPVQVKFNRPLKSIDVSKIHITSNSDILQGVSASINANDNSIINISHNAFAPNSLYKVVFEEGAITDTLYNETFDWSFTTGSTIDEISEVIENSVSIHPNPTNGIITVKSDNLDINSVTVIDITGKVMFVTYDKHRGLTIDLSGYNKGVYFVKVNTNNKFYIEKIIKL